MPAATRSLSAVLVAAGAAMNRSVLGTRWQDEGRPIAHLAVRVIKHRHPIGGRHLSSWCGWAIYTKRAHKVTDSQVPTCEHCIAERAKAMEPTEGAP